MEFIKWVALAILSGFVTVISWNANKLDHRVTELEANKADIKALEEIRGNMREHRGESRQAFADVQNTLNQILLKLPRDDHRS